MPKLIALAIPHQFGVYKVRRLDQQTDWTIWHLEKENIAAEMTDEG